MAPRARAISAIPNGVIVYYPRQKITNMKETFIWRYLSSRLQNSGPMLPCDGGLKMAAVTVLRPKILAVSEI